MTQEGQGHTPDETPRPITTRWSEDPLANDDELAPPFVPGRAAGARPAPDAPGQDTPADAEPWAAEEDAVPEATGAVVEEEATTAPPGDPDTGTVEEGEAPFPFDAPWDQGTETQQEAEEGDFPFDQLDDDAEPEARADVEADRGDFLPGEGGPVTTPEEAVAAQPGPDGWEPFGAEPEEGDGSDADTESEPYAGTVPYADVEPYRDTEPETAGEAYADADPYVDAEPYADVSEAADSGYSEPWHEEAALDGDEGGAEAEGAPADAGPVSAVEEVAALLERLSDRLREEGVSALQAEMESEDRLTSLVAGLLAGYVSGRS